MRKRIIGQESRKPAAVEGDWIDLAHVAEVEITSERPDAPIEEALGSDGGKGWRAGEPGPQVIRIMFDEPHDLSRVRLVIDETERARTQEIAVRWSPDGGATWRDVVRQQWNFSPDGSTREVEDFAVELAGATALELRIVPEIGGGPAEASLTSLRVA